MITNKFTKHQLKWLEALESGEYKQGYKRLKGKSGGYCCLGVATRVVDPEYKIHVLEYAASMVVVGKLNLLDEFGSHKNSDPENSLVTLNDELGYTFKEIAKHLRENPSDYFTNFDEYYEAPKGGTKEDV